MTAYRDYRGLEMPDYALLSKPGVPPPSTLMKVRIPGPGFIQAVSASGDEEMCSIASIKRDT